MPDFSQYAKTAPPAKPAQWFKLNNLLDEAAVEQDLELMRESCSSVSKESFVKFITCTICCDVFGKVYQDAASLIYEKVLTIADKRFDW